MPTAATAPSWPLHVAFWAAHAGAFEKKRPCCQGEGSFLEEGSEKAMVVKVDLLIRWLEKSSKISKCSPIGDENGDESHCRIRKIIILNKAKLRGNNWKQIQCKVVD